MASNFDTPKFLAGYVSFLLLFINICFIQAQQYPIVLTPVILPPYSPYLSDYSGNSLLLTIENTDADNDQTIKIAGFLDGANTHIHIELPPSNIHTTFLIHAGETLSKTGYQLQPYFNIGAGDIIVTNYSKDVIVLTQALPEDEYTFCVRAYYEDNSPASDEGECSLFTVTYPDPSVVLNPLCDDTVLALNPQALTIQWSYPTAPLGTSPASLTYTLKIVDLIPVTRDPNDAMNSATTPSFFERKVNGLSYFYGPSDPQLVPGHKYALQVIVSDPNKKIAFKNSGKSEVCAFNYVQPKVQKYSATHNAVRSFLSNENIYSSPTSHELADYFNPELKTLDSIPTNYPIKYIPLPEITSEKLKEARKEYNAASVFKDSDQIAIQRNFSQYFVNVDSFTTFLESYEGENLDEMKLLSRSLDTLKMNGKDILAYGVAFRNAEATYINDELSALNSQLQELLHQDYKADSVAIQNIGDSMLVQDMRDRGLIQSIKDSIAAREIKDKINIQGIRDKIAVKEISDTLAIQGIRDSSVARNLRDNMAIQNIQDSMAARNIRNNTAIQNIRDNITARKMEDSLAVLYDIDLADDISLTLKAALINNVGKHPPKEESHGKNSYNSSDKNYINEKLLKVLYKALPPPSNDVVQLRMYPFYYNEKKPTANDSAVVGLIVRLVPYMFKDSKSYSKNYAQGNAFTSPAFADVSIGRYFVRFYKPDGKTEIMVLGGEDRHAIDLSTERIKPNGSDVPYLKVLFPINLTPQ